MTDVSVDEALADRPARTIRFSTEAALGLVIVTVGSTPSPPQPAQGSVEVPAGAAVVIMITGEIEGGPSLLDSLEPDDIDAIMNFPGGDDWLAAVSRLTRISNLMIGGEVSDQGLEHLGKLVNLSMLGFTAGPSVTADGMRHLAKLPNLARLMLGGPVTLDVLKPLAEAERLGGLQVPQADEATQEGLRELFPDMPIGGVWLSPKARRRLQAKKEKAVTT